MVDRYPAIAIQSNVTMVDISKSESDIRQVERQNLIRACELIGWAGREAGPGPKLMVLPESFLHSFPRGTNPKLKDLIPMCIRIPGEETDLLGRYAIEHHAFICGAAYEYMPDWSGRIWNAAFIIEPQKGKVILKHHKTNSESGSDPNRVLKEYVRRFGEESLFSVVDTEIGKLGAFICAEGLFRTEVARCLAMNGAEILCFPLSTVSPDHDYFHTSSQAHAYFNQCYLVGANLGLTISKERPRATGGGSLIIDYEGKIMKEAPVTDETTIRANIDLKALRAYRAAKSFLLAGGGFNSDLYIPYKKEYRHKELRSDLEPVESYGEEWASFDKGEGKERRVKQLKYLYENGRLVKP